MSSTEAEHIAAASTAAELISLNGIARNLTNEMSTKTALFVDNRGAIDLTKGYENSKRSRHIDIKYHFKKDLVAKNVLSIEYVTTEENRADILTKS